MVKTGVKSFLTSSEKARRAGARIVAVNNISLAVPASGDQLYVALLSNLLTSFLSRALISFIVKGRISSLILKPILHIKFVRRFGEAA